MKNKKIVDEAKKPLPSGSQFFVSSKKYLGKLAFQCRLFFKNQAGKEATLFPKSKYPLSFKPFLAAQGFIVLLLFVVLASFFIPQNKFNQTLVIKTAATKQISAAVAGQPVQWVTLIKKSDITKDNYLAKLPKNSRNIKIATISSAQAKGILAASTSKKTDLLTLEQKKKLASANQPKSFFVASIFDSISKFFLSSIEDGADQIAEQATQPEIKVVEDVKVVDLSSEIVEEQPAEKETKKVEQELKKEEKEEIKEQEEQQEEPAPVEQAQPPVEAPVEAAEEQQPAVETPPETPVAEEEPVAETKDEYVKIDYETPAPQITEQNTDTGKLVTVSSPNEIAPMSDIGETSTPATTYTDVLAFTNIPEIFKVGQESKIKIKWQNNENQDMVFHAYDTNNNGKLDYVEWTVPHLSDQIFEIIFISKAFRLDENRQITEDIYDIVATQDDIYATVQNNEWLRFTFESLVDSSKTIDIYAKPTSEVGLAYLEVYRENGDQVIAILNIDHEDYYHVSMANLGDNPTDVFDFKILGGVDIDYVQDLGCMSATMYWAGHRCGSDNLNWSNAASWSTSTSTCTGGVVPGAYPVVFDSSDTSSADINQAVNTGQCGMTISSGYTGTITQTGSYTFLVSSYSQADGTFVGGSGTWAINNSSTFSGGTFTGGGGAMTVPLGLTLSGGTFTQGTGAISVRSLTISGTPTFTKNASGLTNFKYNMSPSTLTSNGKDMGNIQVSVGASGNTTLTLQDPLQADNITIDASQTLDTKSGVNNAISCAGNWTNSGTFTAQSGTVTFNGTGTQTINSGGSSFYNVTLNNSTNAFTLLTNAMTVGNNLVISEARTPIITATTSEAFTVTGTTDGTNGGSVETLTVNTTGAVTFTGAVGTGDADMLTALTITNSAALLFSSTINITGALTQTNAATGTTTFSNTVAVGSATLKGATYFVNDSFTSTGAIAVTNSNYFQNVGAIVAPGGFSTSGAVTLANNITTTNTALSIGGNLEIGAAATPTLAAGSGAITVTGTTDGVDGGAVETLAVDTTGAVTFTGAVGTGDADMLTALTITNSAALLFSAAVNITGAFAQTNPATGTTTFSSTLATGSATFRGTTINLGGTTTISGNLTIAVGTLDVTTGNFALNVSGNWINSVGASGFTARAGTVTLNGTNQSITGATTWYNLSKTDTTDNSTDVILTFDNTATQTIGIGGLLTLQGIDDNDRVNLVSDSPGTRWELAANGTLAINWVDTTDSDASGGSPITFTNTLGAAQNNLNWNFNTASASPTSPTQLKNDASTTITNAGYTNETNVNLRASAVDPDTTEVINLFFEAVENSGSFTSPAVPTTGGSCVTTTTDANCASNIWYVTSSSGDYSSTPFTGTTNVAGLANATGYKWQVKACDDDSACSAWVAFNASTPNFTIDTTEPTITAITSVAGDATPTYYDTTDNNSTLVVYTADADAVTCKWDSSNTTYDLMANTCTSTTNCTLTLSGESAKTVYMRCVDTAGNKATSSYTLNYTIDATPPTQSAWNPATTSTITTATPTITLTLNENGDCKSSTTDQAYASMSTDCAGDGTTSISCTTTSLAPDGAKDVYIACKDTAGNEDSIASNTKLSYTLDTTPPTTSNYSPSDGSTIVDFTPEITFDTNELGDCFISQTNYSYADMVINTQVDCVENGLTHTCQMTSLLPDGAKTIYIACEDWPMANKDTTLTTDHIHYTLDTTPSTIVFSNDVASGPVQTDTITADWGDASVKKWEYDADGNCPTTAGSYSKTDANSMYQDTQTNNGSYICLYAEDAFGNKSTQASANDINIDATAPTVTGVTSSLTNGSYTTDQVVPIQISFTEDVTVSGTPQLTLSTSSPATTAVNYATGSGTSTLTFNYTVSAGNTSADLDYYLTTSLTLNGGTIKDAVGNNATLTLATPGATHSLGANKDLIIDTTNPIITITNPNTDLAQSKTITASKNEGTLTMSNTTGSDCDGSHGLVFITYASQTFTSESNNGTKVCYKAVDTATNTTYSLSNAIAGIDTTLPTLSGFSPATTSIITDTTPTITFSLSETGDCYASTTDWGYDDMASHVISDEAVDCSENGLNMTCQMASLLPDGSKAIYISCEDFPAINKNTSANNTGLTYTLDTTAPTTTATATAGGSSYTFSDWTKQSSAIVTLSCDDGTGAGCSATKYCTDTNNTCSPTTTYDSGNKPTITDQGTTYIRFYSTDVATNSEIVGVNNSKIIKIDTIAPTNVSISSITADSSTQLTITASTATDAVAGLNTTPYQIEETTGNSGATSSSYQSSASHIDTGLTPNTIYTYKVRAKDALENTSAYSSTSSKYTLANVPSTPSLTADSATQITVTLTTDSNPSGTYYLITNSTTSSNSGWTTDASWISSGLTCNTSYTFTVKAKNGNGAETAASTASATTAGCPGGGLPAFLYMPPTPPLTGFQVLINGGSVTTNSQDVILFIRGSSDTARMSVSNDINFINAVQEPYTIIKSWKLSDGQGLKTVYVKFFTAYGVSSNTITASINYQIPSIFAPIIDIIIPPATPTLPIEPSLQPLPPVEETVTKDAPKALSGTWSIMPTKSIEGFVLQSLPAELKVMAKKFPQLGITLDEIGIKKATNLNKLYGNNLSLPGLSQAIEQNVHFSGLAGSEVDSKNFTLPQGVALDHLTLQLKEKMPTEVLFVRGGNGTVDRETSISISDKGEIQQKVGAIAGESLQLIIKAENSIKAIKGYLIFKQRGIKSSTQNIIKKTTASLLTSALKDEVPTAVPSRILDEVGRSDIEQALVVKEFYYEDNDGDGIWTANITVPVVDGEYEIINVLEYNNPKLLPKELKLITVVDPEGYIYYQTGQGKLRIENAKISLFWLNPEGPGGHPQYELWPAKNYQQTNPQIADDTGRYAFLTPKGTYYLLVEAKGYSSYKGEDIEVVEGNEIHQNIGLEKGFWLFNYLDWKAGAILVLIILVGLNFYRDRIRTLVNKKRKV